VLGGEPASGELEQLEQLEQVGDCIQIDRPGWLESTSEEARSRADRFRVA
tara:strand:- start:2564 stop:2713 length:150 start_codon:yes stop_codon:yes gene_type:complete